MSTKDKYSEHQSHILLVDDDPIMCELASTRLLDAGYTVDVAHNGEDALEFLQSSHADLVISDINMPGMDGFELTRRIIASPALQTIPVIVITASDRPDVAADAFEAGATSFLDKPINWTLFSHAVKFVLRASYDQKALRIARDQAEAGARFKDSLMSVMSHELRTPLNAIIGFGQLLHDKFVEDDDKLNVEYADYIIGGGQRLLNSVSDMLLASDARSGPIVLNEVDATLEELADLSCSYVRKDLELSQASIEVKLHDPGMEVRCDRQLLARSISKLIDNAMKFSSPGVKILLASVRTRDGRLAIIVRDNGPGIAEDKLKLIAMPFTQSDMSLRRSKEGLGLGIPLVKAIASSHEGQFYLDTKVGSGTQAIILLPAKRIVHVSAPIVEDSRELVEEKLAG